MLHVDDFIFDETIVSTEELGDVDYAKQFLLAYRRPAAEQYDKPFDGKLFCVYKDKKYRCTGCSRLGDVWLSIDFDRTMGYDLRVDVMDCRKWSKE